MSISDPIIVGVGQMTHKSEDFLHPLQAMKTVVQRAADDAECHDLIDSADALHVVNTFTWNYRKAPRALAETLNINPSLKEYTTIGGDTPQMLVNRVADNIASGKNEIAILAGCEVMHSVKCASAAGKPPEGFRNSFIDITPIGDDSEGILIGNKRFGNNDYELDHFMDMPVRIYPLIENALRAKEALTIEQQFENLGKFGETFSAVAAKNPYAWSRHSLTATQVITPSPQNRMISFPYTKLLNANIFVDQAAALIMTTPQTAHKFGIPEEKWVYNHGGQDAHDIWFISERKDIADSPAINACVQDALQQAGLTLDDISFFDFYSCFPCMPRLYRLVLGIEHTDPRPMTLTGGLPYFGGPGSNYVMHSIAEAVNRCRMKPDKYGLITSNGWYCTKHSTGIYSCRKPQNRWSRTPSALFQQQLILPKSLQIDQSPAGSFWVDSYTVWFDRHGEPEVGILLGRTESGKRAFAHTPEGNKDILHAMMQKEWIGIRGKIIGKKGNVNIVDF
jgi:acetyl-CoA C-acetyltransferase